jgi:translation elongation factor EF-4
VVTCSTNLQSANVSPALLLVDASQGVQAQTVANFYMAFSQGLQLVPVINKIDLPSADAQRALDQMRDTFELDTSKAILVSGTGYRRSLKRPKLRFS